MLHFLIKQNEKLRITLAKKRIFHKGNSSAQLLALIEENDQSYCDAIKRKVDQQAANKSVTTLKKPSW